MSRPAITKIVFLLCLCFGVGRLDGWTETLEISIPSSEVYTAPNQSVDVWAYVVSGGPVLPEGNWSWNWPAELNGTYDPYDYSSRGSFSSSFAGCYTVWANAWNDNGSDSDSAHVYVVEVAKLQYWDEISSQWVDITGTLYVVVGDHVVFKAVPNPGDAFWPTGKPVWDGSSGASGTGETAGVGFHTLSSSTDDYKTVTATCGNTVTVNVIVYDYQGTLDPKDDFNGRSQSCYGLEEKVDLGWDITPCGLTPIEINGLTWYLLDGVGYLDADPWYGTGVYDAGESVGDVTLVLVVMSGPSAGVGFFNPYNRTVIAPSGTRMTRVDPDFVWHEFNTASAGIKLHYWLDPTNVSFRYLTFGEGSCPPTPAWGVCSEKGSHSQNYFGAILGGHITNGCRVIAEDRPWCRVVPWNAGDGGWTWNIPTQYIDDTSTRHTFGGTQNHVSQVWANGNATQSKAGHSGSAKASDPDSPW